MKDCGQTFNIQLLFRAATESFLTYRAANNTIPTLAPFNPCGVSAMENKSRND